MRCPIENQDNSELLLAYCARRLDFTATAQVESHLRECPACREFRDAQQAVWDALDRWEPAPVTDDFDARLYRRIESEMRRPWWQRLLDPVRPVLANRGLPVAAAACLLVMAGMLAERPRQIDAPAPPQQAHAQAVQPDQVERTLDDMELLHTLTDPVHAEAQPSSSM